jgi:hypothetical protein
MYSKILGAICSNTNIHALVAKFTMRALFTFLSVIPYTQITMKGKGVGQGVETSGNAGPMYDARVMSGEDTIEHLEGSSIGAGTKRGMRTGT